MEEIKIRMEGFKVRADGSEDINYNAPDFPVRSGYSCLAIFPGFTAGCHWHRDFEMLLAVDNAMNYQVNGVRVPLRKGDAIFVNSGRLHFGYSEKGQECHYGYAVFHPEFLGYNSVIVSILERLESDSSPDYFVFKPEDADGRAAIEAIRFLCDHDTVQEALGVQSACAKLLNYVDRRSTSAALPPDPDWAIIRAMTGYIQVHYQETVHLDMIAEAGAVCRSRCCELFRRKLGVSPLVYVNRYRLEKACGLLRDGKSVTEAGFASGFQSASYFSETFRKFYGCTPSDYILKSRVNFE